MWALCICCAAESPTLKLRANDISSNHYPLTHITRNRKSLERLYDDVTHTNRSEEANAELLLFI